MAQNITIYMLVNQMLKQYVVLHILVTIPIVNVSYYNCPIINTNNCVALCDPKCSNGGQCYHESNQNHCRCPAGFTGKSCEYGK